MIKNNVTEMINAAISTGIFPGAVLLCSVHQKIVFHDAWGMADIFEQRRMEKNSVFDLASLTKPLATTLAVARLIEKKLLFLDQKIGDILPEFSRSAKAGITIDMLLRHTAGFPAYREYFKEMTASDKTPRQCLKDLLVREPLENSIGEKQVYSDLGFMILAWIIETITGQGLDRYVTEQVYSPLGIQNLFFLPMDPENRTDTLRIKKMVATQNCPWRKKVLVGEVDDDNAWAAGGVDGHAGLFGDALSIHTLCCEILNALQDKPTKILSHDIIKPLVQRKNQWDMVAGFDTPSKKNSSSGRYFSKASIGHLGFTGTSFWIDPETSVIMIFLTNRVHPLRSNLGIKKFRPQIHDLVYPELI